MPVKIRLRRMGAKHQPSYRIIVADSRTPRGGRYLDQVGFYDPLTNPAKIDIDQAKAVEWLRRGAQPTETVAILLKKYDIEASAVRKGYTPEPGQKPYVERAPTEAAPAPAPVAQPVPEASAAPAPPPAPEAVAAEPTAEEVSETADAESPE